MAQTTIIQFTDDVDGSVLNDDELNRVTFALDGVEYQIDLSSQNAERLNAAFEPWTSAARRVGGRKKSGNTRTDNREKLREIREWATKNGYQVSDRGRIAQEIRDAFEAAN